MKNLHGVGLAMALAILIGWVGCAPADAQDSDHKTEAAATLKKLQSSFDADVKKWRSDQNAAIEKAQQENGPMPAIRMSPPDALMKKHLMAFDAAAKQYAGKDAAIEFHVWVLKHAPGTREKQLIKSTIAVLLSDHIKSTKLASVPSLLGRSQSLVGKSQITNALRNIEANSPHADVKAEAILARVDRDFQRAKVESKEYKNAKQEAQRAAALAKSEKIRTRVKNIISGREVVVKGKKAPDISGVDLDGVSFKLSDYRGKIILLDFWGDW